MENKGEKLLDLIISKTMCRHYGMTEEEYLKAIKFDNTGKTEEQAVNISLYNILLELSKEVLKANDAVNSMKYQFAMFVKPQVVQMVEEYAKNHKGDK